MFLLPFPLVPFQPHPSPTPITQAQTTKINTPQPFHTEATGDILAWQTRSTAAEGGKCILASAYTAYNYLAATCPEVIRTLAAPNWPFALYVSFLSIMSRTPPTPPLIQLQQTDN